MLSIVRKHAVAFLVIVIFSHSSIVYAIEGGANGGGGLGVVCPDSSKKSKMTAYLYDLYEADRNKTWKEKGWRIQRSTESVEAQIQKALNRLSSVNTVLQKDLAATIVMIKSNLVYTEPNDALYKSPDMPNDPLVIEEPCKPKWLAFYDDTKSRDAITIVTKYKNSLLPTDEAALFIHEAMYRLMRHAYYTHTVASSEYNSGRVLALQDSFADPRKVREMTAALFSNMSDKELIELFNFNSNACPSIGQSYNRDVPIKCLHKYSQIRAQHDLDRALLAAIQSGDSQKLNAQIAAYEIVDGELLQGKLSDSSLCYQCGERVDPLYNAVAYQKSFDVFKLVFEKGKKDPNQMVHGTPLIALAIVEKRYDIVDYLLRTFPHLKPFDQEVFHHQYFAYDYEDDYGDTRTKRFDMEDDYTLLELAKKIKDQKMIDLLRSHGLR